MKDRGKERLESESPYSCDSFVLQVTPTMSPYYNWSASLYLVDGTGSKSSSKNYPYVFQNVVSLIH